jgi:hypothetical protein
VTAQASLGPQSRIKLDRPPLLATKGAPLEGRCTLGDANRCGGLTVITSRDRFDITKTGVQSLDRLEAYLEAERFRGYDPYDALSSPVFSIGRPSLVEVASNSSRASAQTDRPVQRRLLGLRL